MQQTLAELKVQTHPDKTFIGRTCRGFDFLGYRSGAQGLVGVAEPTLARFRERPPASDLLGEEITKNPAATK